MRVLCVYSMRERVTVQREILINKFPFKQKQNKQNTSSLNKKYMWLCFETLKLYDLKSCHMKLLCHV